MCIRDRVYSVLAPIYLFFQMKEASLAVAAVLCAIAMILLPINNIFRAHIEKLKTEYWACMEDLTGYYLESVQAVSYTHLDVYKRQVGDTPQPDAGPGRRKGLPLLQ